MDPEDFVYSTFLDFSITPWSITKKEIEYIAYIYGPWERH